MIMCEKDSKNRKNSLNPLNSGNKEDIWNVPLATAVAQLNGQKVIHSLIQVVVYACSET
jgi:hypothetical protein